MDALETLLDEGGKHLEQCAVDARALDKAFMNGTLADFVKQLRDREQFNVDGSSSDPGNPSGTG